MSPATRNWLEKAVGSGIEWKEMKRLTRVKVESPDLSGGENKKFSRPDGVARETKHQ